MAWSTAGRNRRADANAALIAAVSLHSGDPGANGTANEVSGGGYSRQAPSFPGASSGSTQASVDFTGPASGSVSFYGLWASDATFLGAEPTGGDSSFNAAGEATVTVTVTSTSTI